MSESSWAVVELLGHVRIAGRVSEEERFGTKLGRIDVPQLDGGFVTQYFSGSSLYRMTPCTEEVARAVAGRCDREPAYAWDVRRALGLQATASEDDADDDCDWHRDHDED